MSPDNYFASYKRLFHGTAYLKYPGKSLKEFHLLKSRIVLLLLLSALAPLQGMAQYKEKALDLFQAVYGTGNADITSLVTEDVVISYPVFETIFKKKVLRGREAYLAFANRFKTRWKNRKMQLHEAIEEDGRVVLVWSFSATSNNPEAPSDQLQNWGGITYYRFDAHGRVRAEIGEESAPGPFGRGENE